MRKGKALDLKQNNISLLNFERCRYQYMIILLRQVVVCASSCIWARIQLMGNSSVTHVTFFQFFHFHQATIKHLVDQSNKFKANDDLGVQFYITT